MPLTLAAICSALSLSACSAPEPPHMLTPYFEDDFRFWTDTGPSSLEGTLAIKQDDGQVLSCAGSTVNLLPATAYNMELEQYLEQGQYPTDYSRHARQFTRTVTCDSNGHFFADNLPTLKWIIVVHVSWNEQSSVAWISDVLGNDGKGGWVFQEKKLGSGKNTLTFTKDDLVLAK